MTIPPNFMAGKEDRYMHQPEKEKNMAETQKKISRYDLERAIARTDIYCAAYCDECNGRAAIDNDTVSRIIDSLQPVFDSAGIAIC